MNKGVGYRELYDKTWGKKVGNGEEERGGEQKEEERRKEGREDPPCGSKRV